jgi:CO dehydrogenase maturation factor
MSGTAVAGRARTPGRDGSGGVRLAICGKGGVGKTAVAALLIRALLDGGSAGRLLAIDADPAMGLALALGVPVQKTIGHVREIILAAARSGSDVAMTEVAGMLDYEVMEALVETEGASLLAMGRSEARGCYCSVNDLLRDAIRLLSDRFDTIVIDGEAGLEQINRQVVSELDSLIMVSDASARGLQTVGLLRDMIRDREVIRCYRAGVVFNRVSGGRLLLEQAAADMGVQVFGFVPDDPMIAEFDLVGRPLSELPPESAAARAVRGMVSAALG